MALVRRAGGSLQAAYHTMVLCVIKYIYMLTRIYYEVFPNCNNYHWIPLRLACLMAAYNYEDVIENKAKCSFILTHGFDTGSNKREKRSKLTIRRLFTRMPRNNNNSAIMSALQ